MNEFTKTECLPNFVLKFKFLENLRKPFTFHRCYGVMSSINNIYMDVLGSVRFGFLKTLYFPREFRIFFSFFESGV